MTKQKVTDLASKSSKAKELGIDNTVPQAMVGNVLMAGFYLNQLDMFVDHITSWFRCPALNDAVGGAPGSYHQSGLAIDFVPKGIDNDQFLYISRGLRLPFQQVITYEATPHVHVSFHRPGEGLSKQPTYLVAKAGGGYRRV